MKNDFTKEELQHILGHMKWAYDIDATEQNLLMIDKIQSMIDNYCDHKGSIPSIRQYTSMQCPKCGVVK